MNNKAKKYVLSGLVALATVLPVMPVYANDNNFNGDAPALSASKK